MKSLQELHQQYIGRANQSMTMSGLPIRARAADVPVVAMERWHELGSALHKTYRFRRMTDRNTFVMQLLAYETSTEHAADMQVSADSVSLKVQTKDLGKATEVDLEYAKYADILFKSLAYNPGHGDET